MGVVRVVFWAWVIISIVLLIQRRVARYREGSPPPASTVITTTARPAPSPASEPEPAGPSAVNREQVTETPSPTATLFGQVAPTRPARPSPRSEPTAATQEATAESPGRRGFFAPAEPDPSGPRSTTLAEALEGFTWPCELAPHVDAACDPAVRAVFVTDRAQANEVGVAVADELERLGYELDSETDAVLHAWRADAHLEVTLHPRAVAVTAGGTRRWPSLPPDTVAVELQLHI